MVASETGHVYTFATPKLQPMITSEAGKALIQTCLHQPDQATATSSEGNPGHRVRMSSSGYEETDLGGYLPGTEDGRNKVVAFHKCTVEPPKNRHSWGLAFCPL